MGSRRVSECRMSDTQTESLMRSGIAGRHKGTDTAQNGRQDNAQQAVANNLHYSPFYN